VQRSLSVGLSLSLVLLMALLLWLGSTVVRRLSEDLIASRLVNDAETLVAAFDATGLPAPELSRRLHNPIYERPYSGHYYLLRLADGSELRSRSLWDETLNIPNADTGDIHRRRIAGPAGQSLLLLVKSYQKQGQKFTLAVAEGLTPVQQDVTFFQLVFAAVSMAVLLTIVVVQRLIVRRSFRQLDLVREEIQRLERGEIDQLSQHVPAEVLPLVREFNRLLQLLGNRVERSRNALGNLSHALKGPLNLIVQQLDSDALDDQPDLRRRMGEQADRIHQLMERELRRARLTGAATPGRRFDAAKEIPSLFDVVRQMHSGKLLDLQSDIPEESVLPFDREDMLELVGNLFDNAAKWASSTVRCSILAGENVSLSVEDDGPGCSQQELDLLSQRGVRLDESKAGHGLGLAIARDIVGLYQGEIRFELSSDLGGLAVRVTFPGVPVAPAG
jgi:signal transduction histidine kinase